MAKIDWPTGRYRLTEKAYMSPVPGGEHRILEEDAEITYAGKPGPHMVPLDDGAHQAVALAEEHGGVGTLRPTDTLSMSQGGAA
ncbi:MAG TPA: hypothetical protein VL356_13840 [Acidocella sp.]|jgi:hypothetical protein|nr:hypothetical protein [Acidocella sp.]